MDIRDLDRLLEYIRQHRLPLFKADDGNPLLVLFDERGFRFSDQAELAYRLLKNQPHLYVAHTTSNSAWYVGKSFQPGGRWKRQHAYHLGTLAYHLLGTTRYDDQNHDHWIDAWMNRETLVLDHNRKCIGLTREIFITFIPFHVYAGEEFTRLAKEQVIKLNAQSEKALIDGLRERGVTLLNVPKRPRV